ncbi:MAG: hypothetical protein IJ877_00810 [Candidatus Gastranaerophilales bacterium]|nr:hypothetical protein [Candidatus Gastranaerophilales bacterium]
MSINNVNIAMGASYGAYNQKLTQATKAELDKLGIPYNPNITEQEGKALIAQRKAQNAHNENSQGNFTKNHNAQSNNLFERAKKLAEKLGVAVDENVNFKTLLSLIEQALETKIQTGQNDMNLLQQLKGYSQELASIQAQSMGTTYDTTNQALQMSLEMLSLYNKNFLN